MRAWLLDDPVVRVCDSDVGIDSRVTAVDGDDADKLDNANRDGTDVGGDNDGTIAGGDGDNNIDDDLSEVVVR